MKIRISLIKSRRDNKITIYLLLCATLLSSWAALNGDTTLSSAQFRKIGILILYFFVIASVVSLLLKKARPAFGIMLSALVYWFFEYVHVFDSRYHTVGLFSLVLLLVFGMLSDSDRGDLFEIYKKIMVVMAAVGIICYVAYSVHFPIPYRIVPYYSAAGNYIDYKISYILSAGALSRLCGLFNEPGYFGTLLALILCVDKINLRKVENIILLTAGFMTFSLAFLLIILIYSIFTCCKNLKFALFLVGLVLIFAISFSSFDNIVMNSNSNYLLSRLIYLREALDDRAYSSLDRMFALWTQSDRILFGYGSGYASGTGSSSYKIVLLRYGVIGFFLIYLSLVVPVIKKAKGNFGAYIFIFCFVISLYQRPFVYSLPYYIILYGGIEMYRRTERQ